MLMRAAEAPRTVGYDAGSETNDESCDNIPGGGPCDGLGGEALSLGDDGEGYVRASPGIQGVDDLSSAAYDWRNPLAIVTITRVR